MSIISSSSVQVPSTEWHCSACAERLAIREARAGHSFDDVLRRRDKEMEEELINRAIDRKAAASSKKTDLRSPVDIEVIVIIQYISKDDVHVLSDLNNQAL
jgi:hypothetical protein